MIQPYYSEPSGVIYNADCLEIMKGIADKSVDLVLTDPPYGIGIQNKNCANNRQDSRSNDLIYWDNNFDLKKYINEIIRVSKNRIIWGANYHNCFEGGAIVWDKLQPLPDSSQCEIASISGYKKVFKYTQRWTNFVNDKFSNHPTEKPLELMRWCLENYSEQNMIILDPFLGSGTTARACKDLGRKFIGIEIEKKYCDIAIKRLEQEVLF